MKNIAKLEIIVYHTEEYRDATRSIWNLKCSVPKTIPITFHNGSNYHYHLVIKELAEKIEKQITCLGKNADKYVTFAVPIEKEFTRIDKK